MDEILRHDENTIRVLGGVTDDSNQYIRMLRVDPTTGRLLVTGNGTGGLIEITFTGTVDGSNTVFTVTSAPTYVVSDGVWYKATDNNGIVQWTYSAGSVTMVIPPISSIYGF